MRWPKVSPPIAILAGVMLTLGGLYWLVLLN